MSTAPNGLNPCRKLLEQRDRDPWAAQISAETDMAIIFTSATLSDFDAACGTWDTVAFVVEHPTSGNKAFLCGDGSESNFTVWRLPCRD